MARNTAAPAAKEAETERHCLAMARRVTSHLAARLRDAGAEPTRREVTSCVADVERWLRLAAGAGTAADAEWLAAGPQARFAKEDDRE